jgi:hypothetical protein
MFEQASDGSRRLWLGLVGGLDTVDDDYQNVVTILEQLANTSPPAGEPSVFILIMLPGSTRPPAMWRQRFAQAERRGHGKRIAFVIVSESAALRGIRTAMNWLAPPPAGYETAALASLDDAIAWTERKRPGTGPTLRGLYHDVSTRVARDTTLRSGRFRTTQSDPDLTAGGSRRQ